MAIGNTLDLDFLINKSEYEGKENTYRFNDSSFLEHAYCPTEQPQEKLEIDPPLSFAPVHQMYNINSLLDGTVQKEPTQSTDPAIEKLVWKFKNVMEHEISNPSALNSVGSKEQIGLSIPSEQQQMCHDILSKPLQQLELQSISEVRSIAQIRLEG